MNASTEKTVPDRAPGLGALTPLAAPARRTIFDAALGRRVEAGVFERAAIAVGTLVEGPCVIVEDETTIVVPASAAATCRSDGCIEIFRRDGGRD